MEIDKLDALNRLTLRSLSINTLPFPEISADLLANPTGSQFKPAGCGALAKCESSVRLVNTKLTIMVNLYLK
jgi:hypothetical protein